MPISRIASAIGESVTLKLNAAAGDLRRRGEPVIHLGGGEPQADAPIEAVRRAIAMLETRKIRYTPSAGIPALRQAIVDYTERFYDRRVEHANVIVSGGAKLVLAVCMQAILDPGDEIVFPMPYWVSYAEQAALCGGAPVPAPIQDGSVYPDVADIERKITAKTKAVIINSPNNPSGAMYPAAFIEGVAQLCIERDLYLLMDDIYHRLLFDGREPINVCRYDTRDMDASKLILINGVSKQYAMTGFRVGWAVASREIIGAMNRIQSHQSSGPSCVVQEAAVGALEGDQTCVTELCRTLEHNRDLVCENLSTIDGVRFTRPDGTFYAFADFSHHDADSTALAQRLLDEVLVVTVPGVDFGMEGYLRISTCGTADDIVEGVRRIRWALDPAAPPEITIGSRRLTRTV